MNPNLVPASAPEDFSAGLPAQASGKPAAEVDAAAAPLSRLASIRLAFGALSSRNLHPRRSAYVAFFATVFACMAAAAAVASHDMPLLLGGF